MDANKTNTKTKHFLAATLEFPCFGRGFPFISFYLLVLAEDFIGFAEELQASSCAPWLHHACTAGAECPGHGSTLSQQRQQILKRQYMLILCRVKIIGTDF
jgi:hypothetical protein